MQYPFDDKKAIAPIVSARADAIYKSASAIDAQTEEDHVEQAIDDVKYFISVHSLPNLNVFTGENAAALFNDPRPMLMFMYDADKGESGAHTAAGDEGTVAKADKLNRAFEDTARKVSDSAKYRVVTSLVGSNEPMDMRLMDYVSVDYEDLPCVRVIRDPTGHMLKYKYDTAKYDTTGDGSRYADRRFDGSSQAAKDKSYLENGYAVLGEGLDVDAAAARVDQFTKDVLVGGAHAHLKSESPLPRSQNPTDGQTIFKLSGDEFLEITSKYNTLVEYMAPWCGHCKKLEPIYKELAAKYNVPGSEILVAKFDATANDVPLEVTDTIQGYPTVKLYKKSPTASVHYAGDRDINTFVEFIETHVAPSAQGAAGRGKEEL